MISNEATLAKKDEASRTLYGRVMLIKGRWTIICREFAIDQSRFKDVENTKLVIKLDVIKVLPLISIDLEAISRAFSCFL